MNLRGLTGCEKYINCALPLLAFRQELAPGAEVGVKQEVRGESEWRNRDSRIVRHAWLQKITMI